MTTEPRRPSRNLPKVQPRTPRGTTFIKPRLARMTTTLWTYPSQHYDGPGGPLQGDPNYAGATPGWVIWQVIDRFAPSGGVVVDPMCGSGTTLDVCNDLGRRGVGFDLAPRRRDIRQSDARDLPLDDASADLAFVDPPYSTHLRYSDDSACIGRLDAGGDDRGRAYFDAMRHVLAELERVLRQGGVLAVYVSDSGVQRGEQWEFVPIGFHLWGIMMDLGFHPIDIVCVVRGNAKLAQPGRRQAAEQGGMMRGFNFLLLARKPEGGPARGRVRRPG